MSRIATPLTLPSKTRKWLDAKLIETSFSNYSQLSRQLQEQGFNVSRSALHRYGKVLKERLELMQAQYRDGNDKMAHCLCILAAAISNPENVPATAAEYLNLVRQNNGSGG